jgi:hypothetical protein
MIGCILFISNKRVAIRKVIVKTSERWSSGFKNRLSTEKVAEESAD